MIEGVLLIISLVLLHIQDKRELDLLEIIITYIVFSLLIINGIILVIFDFLECVNDSSSNYIRLAVFYAIVFVLYLICKLTITFNKFF